MSAVFHVVRHQPGIPPNTGNVIRTTAVAGATLHLVEPLGFVLDDAHLRRAGLDYHDLTHVLVHPEFEALMAALTDPPPNLPGHRPTGRVFAFTGRATTHHTAVPYRPGDALLLGTEPTGLPDEVLADPRLTALVRIPMVPGARSLNLSNAAAIALYEAWRQHDFAGGA